MQKKHKIFIIGLIISFFVFAFIPIRQAKALESTDFTNHQVPEAYIYPQEFDKLVMDLTIPNGNNGAEDILEALTLQNTGTARDYNDIEKLIMWQDAGLEGFQGMAIDKEIGTFSYNGLDSSWYLDNLDLLVPIQGVRIFISAEINKNATTNRSIQIKIPVLSDVSSNNSFDLGDQGIFMQSGQNGPDNTAIINAYAQAVRIINLENLAPKTVIAEPENNEILNSSEYIIKGVARDQGGSTPEWVKIGINLLAGPAQVIWHDVTATGSNYSTWEYEWNNINEGVYTLQTKSSDWLGNTGVSENTVVVQVDFVEPVPEPELVPEPEPVSEPEPEKTPPLPEATEGKAISEMTVQELEQMIIQVQQQIQELLKQLIKSLLEQISGCSGCYL